MTEKLIELGLERETAEKVNDLFSTALAEKQTQFDEFRLKAESELNELRVDNAIDMGLIKAGGGKNMRIIKALIRKEDIHNDESGYLTGIDEQIKQLKDDSETGFLFENDTPEVIGVSAAGEGMDFSVDNLSYEQLCAYFDANPNVME